jgi:hypothetical protein
VLAALGTEEFGCVINPGLGREATVSSQHKAPLAAFVVVSIACIVVVVNALHSDASAITGFLKHPTQALVSRLPMMAKQQAPTSSAPHAVVKAKAGLAAAPTVVEQVAGTADGASTKHRQKKRHHAVAAGTQVLVPAPAAPGTASAPTAPVIAAAAEAATHDHAGAAQQWQGHDPQPLPSAYGQFGHRTDGAPYAAQGWSGPRHHGRGWHSYAAQQASSGRPGAATSGGGEVSASLADTSNAGWSANGDGWRSGHGRSHGSAWSNGWASGHGDAWSNGWARGHGNGWGSGHGNGWSSGHGNWGNGSGNGRHGRH